MLRIAVCEDERMAAEEIRGLIESAEETARVTLFASAEAFFAAGEAFDVIFLDIGLPGADGMAAAKRIRADGSGAVLIFVTADESRVFEAFDVGAFHYLTKPVDPARFAEIYARAKNAVLHGTGGGSAPTGEKREAQGADGDCAPAEFLLKAGSRHVYIRKRDIQYVESRGRKLLIATGRERVEIYGVLSKWERRLGEGFFRCHRSYLVQLRHVKSYDSASILLKNGDRIWLSRDRYAAFVRIYMCFLQESDVGYD